MTSDNDNTPQHQQNPQRQAGRPQRRQQQNEQNQLNQCQQKPRIPNFIFGGTCTLILFFALEAGGFGTVNALTALASNPAALAPIAQFLLSVLVGLAYFILLVVIVRAIMRFNGHQKQHPGGFDFGDAVMDAMSRISQGDFNVFIEPSFNGMHFEVAEAINQMAQKLGTMEHLRQDFISNVSHEIQSPLTSISGFAELLQSGTLAPEQEQHYIAIIIAESKRLSRLSDNLLKLSSLESQTTPIACNDYRLDKQLESALLMLEPQWRKKQLVLEMDAVSASFCGDEELLSQVWVNLLYNAIKFTPEGGTISVLLKEQDGEPDEAQTGERGGASNNAWQITVTDTGIGIPVEDQMHIFERFYKVDKSRERAAGGNGLGLSLAKKIVELHNGQITVASTPNTGSTFTVVLPN